jgi:hypothetical protein
MKSTERIEELLHSAILHNEEHEALKQEHQDYKSKVDAIMEDMRTAHFKEEREEKLVQDTLEKINKNRKENALQRKVGVDRTHTMVGIFPFGKLVARLHMDALKVELLFRACSEEEVNGMTITQRKNKLKELELLRVGDDEKEAATKAFKPLSMAVFAVI